MVSYLIKAEWSNGYRCGCCHSSHECGDEWVETLEEAMAKIPDEPPNDHSEWGGVLNIHVFDGSNNGEEVGKGEISWPTGGERGTPYDYTRWSGYKTLPDGSAEFFDKVYNSAGKLLDEPWEDIVRRVREERQQKMVAKAERELEEAKSKLNSLKEDS